MADIWKGNVATWFPLDVDDIMLDEKVEVMAPQEFSGYMFLLFHQWREITLPAEDKKLAKMSRLGRRWKKCRENILACFRPADEVFAEVIHKLSAETPLANRILDLLPGQKPVSMIPKRVANRRLAETYARALIYSYNQWVRGKRGGRPRKPGGYARDTLRVTREKPGQNLLTDYRLQIEPTHTPSELVNTGRASADAGVGVCVNPNAGESGRAATAGEPTRAAHEPAAVLGELYAAAGTSFELTTGAADLRRVTAAAAGFEPPQILAALRHTLEQYAAGKVTSSLVGYFCACVGQISPQRYAEPPQARTPAEERAAYEAQRAEWLAKDLGLPRKKFLDRCIVLCGRFATGTISEALGRVYDDEHAGLVKAANHEDFYARFFEHLEALSPPDADKNALTDEAVEC